MNELVGSLDNEEILKQLEEFREAGLIDYVLPTIPLGEQWVVGWNGHILKFTTEQGIVGFLTGVRITLEWAVKKMGLLGSVPR